jgi:hypothetical protein
MATDARAMADNGDTSLRADCNTLRQMVAPSNLSARDASLCISLSETASVLRTCQMLFCTGSSISCNEDSPEARRAEYSGYQHQHNMW